MQSIASITGHDCLLPFWVKRPFAVGLLEAPDHHSTADFTLHPFKASFQMI
jgi:hypothetical protein